jgi:hypothetical protein
MYLQYHTHTHTHKKKMNVKESPESQNGYKWFYCDLERNQEYFLGCYNKIS